MREWDNHIFQGYKIEDNLYLLRNLVDGCNMYRARVFSDRYGDIDEEVYLNSVIYCGSSDEIKSDIRNHFYKMVKDRDKVAYIFKHEDEYPLYQIWVNNNKQIEFTEVNALQPEPSLEDKFYFEVRSQTSQFKLESSHESLVAFDIIATEHSDTIMTAVASWREIENSMQSGMLRCFVFVNDFLDYNRRGTFETVFIRLAEHQVKFLLQNAEKLRAGFIQTSTVGIYAEEIYRK